MSRAHHDYESETRRQKLARVVRRRRVVFLSVLCRLRIRQLEEQRDKATAALAVQMARFEVLVDELCCALDRIDDFERGGEASAGERPVNWTLQAGSQFGRDARKRPS